MSVFLGSGGAVLLGPGGGVVTDPSCCCGGCSDCCFAQGIYTPFCVDGFGNCYTGSDCDGSCYGDIVPCDSLWRTATTTCCCPDPLESCAQCGESCYQTVDPVTCELFENCTTLGVTCLGCGSKTLLSDLCSPCGVCSICQCDCENCPGCTCTDNISQADCDALRPPTGASGWLQGGNCITNDCAYFWGSDPRCSGHPPTNPLGACCSTLDHRCFDDFLQDECVGPGFEFHVGCTCAQITC